MTTFATLMTAWAVSTPSPVPAYEGDVNLITPGVVGFTITFLIAIATVLLLLDMTRRVRKVRYRSEVREQIALEQAEEVMIATDDETGPQPDGPSGEPAPRTPASP